jgi:3-deoxy-manno-octulosonate cytidylyltransferase (CMP-KDO synthetase)
LTQAAQRDAIAIIPARLASSRLPQKMLLDRTGKPLIQHVYEAARSARKVQRVVVATDDDAIEAAVRAFGGQVARTRADHPNGTSRVAEAARALGGELILNVQGDEPGLRGPMLDALVEALDGAEMATLACALDEATELNVPSCVKVTTGVHGWALRFFRTPVMMAGDRARTYRHLGVYGFRRDTLQTYAALPPSPREDREKLEQLRALDHGIRIRVCVVERPRFGGIDTPQDYEAFVAAYESERGVP